MPTKPRFIPLKEEAVPLNWQNAHRVPRVGRSKTSPWTDIRHGCKLSLAGYFVCNNNTWKFRKKVMRQLYGWGILPEVYRLVMAPLGMVAKSSIICRNACCAHAVPSPPGWRHPPPTCAADQEDIPNTFLINKSLAISLPIWRTKTRDPCNLCTASSINGDQRSVNRDIMLAAEPSEKNEKRSRPQMSTK